MVPEVTFYPAAASGSRPCRPGGSKWQSALPTRRQQVAVGPADRRQRVGLGTIAFTVLRRIRELELMAPEFVFYPAEACGCRPCRPGGSMWVSALPTRRKHVGVGTADPAEACGCRHCRPGGSMWLSALPTRRKHVAVGTAARGCRLSLYVQSERWPRRRV